VGFGGNRLLGIAPKCSLGFKDRLSIQYFDSHNDGYGDHWGATALRAFFDDFFDERSS
jgi:hypothetical protein